MDAVGAAATAPGDGDPAAAAAAAVAAGAGAGGSATLVPPVSGAGVREKRRSSSGSGGVLSRTVRRLISFLPAVGRASPSPRLVADGDGTEGLRRMVNSYTDLGAVGGVCGLSNLGNTCYMNAILQCISNTPGFADYLISSAYRADVNTDNYMGTGGEVVEQLAVLLKAMWSGQHKSLAPREFKAAIAKFAPQFSGYGQHDAQEFLSYLMDAVHEDLNRVTSKPYREDPDGSDGRPDDAIAAECWANHRARNDSVIVQGFQGQLRSVLVCGGCGHRSVRFDPSMYLSLPLPDYTMREIALTVRPADPAREPTRVTCQVHRHGTLGDLRRSLLAQRPAGISDAASLVIAEVYLHRFYKFYSDAQLVEEILDKDVLFAIELPPADDDEVTVAVSHALAGHDVSQEGARFGIPSLIRISRSATHRELADALAASLVRQFGHGAVPPPCPPDAPAQDPSPPESDAMDITDAPSQPRRRRVTFGPMAVSRTAASGASTLETVMDASPPTGGQTWDIDWGRDFQRGAGGGCVGGGDQGAAPRPPVPGGLVRIVGAEETRIEWDRIDWQARLRRASSAGTFVRAPFALTKATGEPLDPTCASTPLEGEAPGATVELIAAWDPDAPETDALRAAIAAAEAGDPSDLRRRGSQAVLSLDDCLELFTREERLSGDDCWHCPRCKTASPATTKALSLWTLPDVLVVHLKRFCYTARWATKLEQSVVFPAVGLDLARHVRGPLTDGRGAVYDLYAVCNHFGGIGGGHYTAHCRHRQTGAFYDFDDSHATPWRQEMSLSRNAYVLFYVRRGASRACFVGAGAEPAVPRVRGASLGFVVGPDEDAEDAIEMDE